jgi:transcriptional regulator with XRE-family HTH domain
MKGTDNSVKVQKIIGSRIRAARDFAKLSRTEFADLLLKNEEYPEVTPRKGGNEITTPTEKLVNRIKQWERGENPVGLEFIPAICDVLHCDVGYLFGNYDEHYHLVADISSATGLSEENVIRLIDWQVGKSNYCLYKVANICIESAFKSLRDYIHIDEARMKMEQFRQKETADNPSDWKSVLQEIETGEQASEHGYTMLKHKDAIRFYARSIANRLERDLEEVYINGID